MFRNYLESISVIHDFRAQTSIFGQGEIFQAGPVSLQHTLSLFEHNLIFWQNKISQSYLLLILPQSRSPISFWHKINGREQDMGQ